MKILKRYFLKEFLKFFFIILLGLTGILLVIEFFDKVDEFYVHHPPIYLVFEYLLLQCPRFLWFASPPSSLLSILITIGIALKWRETTVIQASGGSMKKLSLPFLAIGIIISLLSLALSETITPIATRKASWIRNTKILKHAPRITYREGALWLKGIDGSLVRIQDFVGDKDMVIKPSIFNLDSSFRLVKRVEAESALWINGRWEFNDVTIFDFTQKTREEYKSIMSQVIEEPKIFKAEMRKPDEMSFIELYTYYQRLQRAGFKSLKYAVELYGKFAYPMANFVMVLFGLALALNSRIGGGIRSAGLGLVVIIFYWLIYSLSISLGNIGTIPPSFAPLIAPLVFSIAGGAMYLRIKE